MIKTETMNLDAGVLYVMYDQLAEKGSPVVEYPNDKVARLVCENKMQFPPYLKKGDYKLIRIAQRKGFDIEVFDPEIVWEYDPKKGGQDG